MVALGRLRAHSLLRRAQEWPGAPRLSLAGRTALASCPITAQPERTDKERWARMKRQIARWLPPARIVHPYPSQRLIVHTVIGLILIPRSAGLSPQPRTGM